MEAQKKLAKLVRVSKEASESKGQHILLSVSPEGTIRVDGSSNFVQAVTENEELYNNLTNSLLAKIAPPDGGNIGTLFSVQYPLLPFPPSSSKWMGSVKIRAILRKMMATIGYGRAGNLRFGQGEAPVGWPVDDIPWEGFLGTTRSKLTIQQITHAIVSMLAAVGLDAETHVRAPVADDDEEDVGEQEEVLEEMLVEQDEVMDEIFVEQEEIVVMQNEAFDVITVQQTGVVGKIDEVEVPEDDTLYGGHGHMIEHDYV